MKIYKKTIASFIFLFCITGCFKIQDKNIESKNAKIVKKSFYENGNIEVESEFLNNQLYGISKRWSESGILLNKVEYMNGLVHGDWILYYPTGVIKQVTQYKFGKKHGFEKWFYQNSQLKSEIEYENDKPITNIVRFDENGNLIY